MSRRARLTEKELERAVDELLEEHALADDDVSSEDSSLPIADAFSRDRDPWLKLLAPPPKTRRR